MKARRSRWIWIGLAIALVAFIVWLIAPHGEPTTGQAGAAGRAGAAAGAAGGRGGGGGGRRGGAGAPSTVGSARTVQGDAPIYLFELGTATPAQTVTVRTQISGQLMSVAFKEGQTVSKGQTLAQIDPRPYEQALLQAEGNQARDEATLANARIDLTRYETLVAQDSISTQTRDTQRALVRQLEGTVKTDQAAVGAAKLNLVYCRITSPVTGRVGLRQVDPGNYVTPGDANGIVVVTEVTPIDVLFTVPEDNLAQVNGRLRTGATLEAAAFDRTQTQQLALGKLLTLDNQVDTTTGTVRAKARFDNSNGVLFPNQFVNVRLLVDTLHNVVLAPTASVLRGSQGLFVWVVNQPGNTVEMRTVKTGPAVGENTAITSGLDAGEIVVTDGSDRLRDGQRVFLPGDCIPTPRGGAGGGRGGAGGAGAAAGGKGAAAGAAGAQAPAPEKDIWNLWGLIPTKAKPSADPMAAMRCKPGQRSGGVAGTTNTGGANGIATAAPAPVSPDSTPAPGGHHQRMGGGQGGQAPAQGGQAGGQAPAQGGQAGQGAGAPQPGHMSARMQAMFAPLNLDAAQQTKMSAIMEANQAKMRAAYEAGDMAGARAMRQAMDAQIDAILRPDQKAKMQQIRADAAARRAAGGGGGQGPQ
jgi:multidrug efflux system membrane fusion protein